MNFDVRFHQAMIAAGAITPWGERIRRRLRRPGREEPSREMSIRLEERRRERTRVARDLHDTLFQGFLAASLLLHEAADEMPADSPGKPSVTRALGAIERALAETRAALEGWRSPRPVLPSLEQALAALGQESASGANVEFRMRVSGQPTPLEPELEEQIYLIGREALMNALRHSGATKIESEIEYFECGVRLHVHDNGRGIDPEVLRSGRHSHWGLQGMRERAREIGARLSIKSKPGAGTGVELLSSSSGRLLRE